MTATAIAFKRMYQQGLSQNSFTTPEEVVEWFGAVQAQEYPGAKWSLGLRMQHAREEMVDRAFNEGRILRTHVMRPTWHFVLPADIRWLLELTGPRVNAVNAHMYRQYGLDEATFARSQAVFVKALEGGRYLTRQELGGALSEAGISIEGLRLGLMLHRAELDAVICSGPLCGKQHTYALLAERAPQARSLPREEALAELTRRYFTAHGPATVHDFSWWSGLTMADARAGVALVGSALACEELEGKTYWFSSAMPAEVECGPAAILLPTYDELLVGFEGYGKARSAAGQEDSTFYSTIISGGRVIGNWKRTLKKRAVNIQLETSYQPGAAEQAALAEAARRYGEFLGMAVICAYRNWSIEITHPLL